MNTRLEACILIFLVHDEVVIETESLLFYIYYVTNSMHVLDTTSHNRINIGRHSEFGGILQCMELRAYAYPITPSMGLEPPYVHPQSQNRDMIHLAANIAVP